MVSDEVVEPLLHLLGGLGEPLLVEIVHQNYLIVNQRCADRRAETEEDVIGQKKLSAKRSTSLELVVFILGMGSSELGKT